MNNKINIDTSFLDKNEENENFSKKENDINNYDYYKNKKNNDSGNKGLPWGWIIFIGIIVLIGIFSDDSSNTSNYSSSTSNNSNIDYSLGEYRCYSSSYNEALSMKPVDPGLDNMTNEIERLETELKNTYVDEYSQSSVDSYNTKVENVKTKISLYNIKLEEYNNAIDKYNNFLDKNCYK